MERGSDAPLLRRQVRVSRTQRQSIGLAYGQHLYIVDRYIQVLHEPANHRDLLRVFLSKICAVGLSNFEHIQHHVSEPAVLTRTKWATHVYVNAILLHVDAL